MQIAIAGPRPGKLSVAALVVGVAVLGLAEPAQAERPGWYANPSTAGHPQVGATVLGSPGGIKCEPACVGLVHEWTSCTGPGAAGADRPTGGLPFDGRPAPGCVVRARGDLNYVVRPEDEGRHIQLHVIATNYDCGNVRTDGGQECRYSSGQGYSATIGPIAGSVATSGSGPGAVVPRNLALPLISGLLRPAQTLSASSGSWSGTEPLGFSYQWLRCSSSLGGCPPIPGATAARYKVTERDAGARISAIVVASNQAGSMWATSTPTDVVGATGARAGSVRDVRELSPVERLVIARVVVPRPVRSPGVAVLRVRVTDRRGFLIRGATAAVSSEFAGVSTASARTGANGIAVVRVKVRLVRVVGKLVLTVRALKSPRDRSPAVKRISLPVQT